MPITPAHWWHQQVRSCPAHTGSYAANSLYSPSNAISTGKGPYAQKSPFACYTVSHCLQTWAFRWVWILCSCTLQSLEHEKRLIQGMPLEELDALQAKRHAAATKIQACWRGAQQRQQLRLTIPALVSSCTSCLLCLFVLRWGNAEVKLPLQGLPVMPDICHGWRQNSSGSKLVFGYAKYCARMPQPGWGCQCR
jgi:hypothetical protein